jgi:hypothetical protein
MKDEWLDLTELVKRLDNDAIIELHKEQIAMNRWMLEESSLEKWLDVDACKARIRLWMISLFRNVNGFDPISQPPDGWENTL